MDRQIETLLKLDTFEKALVARSSKNKRTHGLKKYIENYNKKEIEEMNNKIYKINVKNPERMSYDDFKQLSKSMQRTYLQSLIDVYKVSLPTIAEMFGVHQSTVSYRAKDLNVKTLSKKHIAMRDDDYKRFIKEMGINNKADEPKPTTTPTKPIEPAAITAPARQENHRFEFVLGGIFDDKMVSGLTLFLESFKGKDLDIKIEVNNVKSCSGIQLQDQHI